MTLARWKDDGGYCLGMEFYEPEPRTEPKTFAQKMSIAYPVPYHLTWEVLDSTKLKTFMECPRKFFYEYILGWRNENPNLHLEFGKAWHFAMEHLILFGYGEDSVVEAQVKLQSHYRKYFSEMMDMSNEPKNPAHALRALLEYVREYRNDKFTPIYTEIAGSVPMDETHRLFFRMDSILEVDGQIRSREHKTGTTLNRQWEDQWSLAIQTGCYNHVLYCLYPQEQVWGVEINGVFFLKTMKKFKRVPARRRMDMMNVWYWNTLDYMLMVDWELSRLAECKITDPVMMAFPQRSSSCTNYFGCSMHDFCMAWANPLQHCYEPPMGFKVEYWDPREEESKYVFHLDKTPLEVVR